MKYTEITRLHIFYSNVGDKYFQANREAIQKI